MVSLKLRRAALLLFALVICPAFIVGSKAGQKDRLKDPRLIDEGGKLFALSCGSAYCHGAGGTGGGAIALRGKGLSEDYLFKTISNGVPGTPMKAFKSDFSEEEIWKMVAFILSPVEQNWGAQPGAPPVNPKKSEPPRNISSSIVGSLEAGRELFFDSSQKLGCSACHAFQGTGGAVGPDLESLTVRPAKEIFMSILSPDDARDHRFETLSITLGDGEKIIAVRKEEDNLSLRVYDITSLPPVLRTIQKTDISKIDKTGSSPMPKDYVSTLTMKQLLDLISFIKRSPVSLKDLL